MNFKESVQILLEKTRTLQETKEVIGEKDVVKALHLLKSIDYQNTADIFLGCASYNLLNTYVKQPDSLVDYYFKRHIPDFLKIVMTFVDGESLRVYDDRNEKVWMIAFWDFQFSFHGIANVELDSDLVHEEMEWDGVRKQMCAKTIFDFALKNGFISNQTQRGEDLTKFLRGKVAAYNKGYYHFEKGKLRVAKDERG